MTYTAPLKDLLFDLEHVAGLQQLAQLPGLQEAGLETAQAVLQECAKFSQEVLAPLNRVGDLQPANCDGAAVTTTPGFKQAYAQYAAAGWQGLQHPVQWGGQGLPQTLGAACDEMINSANLSFALCPLLSNGAAQALLEAGSAQLQSIYLPKLVSGQWTGCMNLTEPQAGSDLSLLRSRAQPQADGSYKIFGNKIFVTYGEHDLAENIVHLVLARLPGAPEGVKGISLFVVPKFLVQADGSLGARNDVQCVSLEHKLGIKASPTATLLYGAGFLGSQLATPGAVGYLVGQENQGLALMFIMMNAARYAVGVQGVALAERAYQAAVAFARERVQGRPVDGSTQASVPIVQHPDVRRMLMTMRALTEGCRALALVTAAAHDTAQHHLDAQERVRQHAFYEFLVPLVKGYCTEVAVQVASLGIQVHGGCGFIEDTGVAQYLRDARILTIYEGTTAIQANDLISRKTLRDGGKTALALAAQITQTQVALVQSGSAQAQVMAKHLDAARQGFLAAVQFVLDKVQQQPNVVFAGSVPYLMLSANLMAGWQLARSWLVAQDQLSCDNDVPFMQAKMATARFYAEHLLSQVPFMSQCMVQSGPSVLEFDFAS